MTAIAQPEAKVFADAKSLAFHRKHLVWDCLSLYYILEEPYAQQALEGGVNVTNVTFGTEEGWDTVVRNVGLGLEQIEKSPLLKLATTAADILKAQEQGKLAVIMGTQGAAMVDRELYRVELLYRLGLRIIGLAYTGATLLGDGCGEKRDAGLSFLGMEFVETVNKLPLLLDLSHSGHRTRAEATKLARAPVCTHSNSYTVNPNDRNTKDETAREIVAKKGMLGICGLPKTVWPQNATLDHMIDHVDHYTKLLGADNVGFGCDFISAYKASGQILPASRHWRLLRPDVFGTVDDFLTQSYPEGLAQIRELPNLTHKLFDRGYSEEQVAGIVGGNWFRVFKDKVG